MTLGEINRKVEGGVVMKTARVIFIGSFLFVFMLISAQSILFPSKAWTQENVEAPVWNVGDKWVFTQGNIEVVAVNQDNYTLNFSQDTSTLESKGFKKIIFDKSTLNRIFVLKEDNQDKYTMAIRRILNFPLIPGMEWTDTFTTIALFGPEKGKTLNFSEVFKVLGWENVEVKAGKFKAIKLAYTQKVESGTAQGISGWAWYWYAPEVRYFVKCVYDKMFWTGVVDWEIVSFQLK